MLKGKTAVTNDSNDEAITGTLELTGNAGTGDVLESNTFYNTDAKTKLTGTMTNHGAVSQTLNAGNSYTIPSGYHNGSGKVTANSLSSQTSGTASAGEILSGKTAWVNGSKITGTMTNRGAVTSSLNAGGSYTIPAGYHNGSGKVTANSLSSQTSGTAAAANILSGKTAYVNGSKITGTMTNHTGTPNKIKNRRLANGRFEVAVDAGYHGCYWNGNSYEYMELSEVASTAGLTAAKLWPGNTVLGITSNKSTMAGKTITPSTSQQTVSCNGKAMTGNIVVNAIPSNYVNINSNPMVFKDGSFGILGTAKRVVKNTTGKYTGYEQVSISNGEILISSSKTNVDKLWAFQKMFKRDDFKKVTYTFQKSSNAFDSLYFCLVLYRNSGKYSFLLSDYLSDSSYDNNVKYERTITLELGSNFEDVTHIGIGINAVWTKSTAAPNARFNNIYLHN